jgi:hypothetical protein
MRRPDFFIVGAPKSGTTAMYEYLREHPDLYLPERNRSARATTWLTSLARKVTSSSARHTSGICTPALPPPKSRRLRRMRASSP